MCVCARVREGERERERERLCVVCVCVCVCVCVRGCGAVRCGVARHGVVRCGRACVRVACFPFFVVCLKHHLPNLQSGSCSLGVVGLNTWSSFSTRCGHANRFY